MRDYPTHRRGGVMYNRDGTLCDDQAAAYAEFKSRPDPRLAPRVPTGLILLDMITRDPRDPEHPTTRRIDLKRQQELIRNHLWHCVMNGKTVTFVPVD